MIMDDPKRWGFGREPLAMSFSIPTATQECRRPDSNRPAHLDTETVKVGYIVGCEHFGDRNSISERSRTRQFALREKLGIRDQFGFAYQDVILAAPHKSARDLTSNVIGANAKKPKTTDAQPALALKQMIEHTLGTLE